MSSVWLSIAPLKPNTSSLSDFSEYLSAVIVYYDMFVISGEFNIQIDNST